MSLVHQPAADHHILELRTQWAPADHVAIVKIAEDLAVQSRSPALTRVHLLAAATYYEKATGKRPLPPL